MFFFGFFFLVAVLVFRLRESSDGKMPRRSANRRGVLASVEATQKFPLIGLLLHVVRCVGEVPPFVS